MNKADRIVLYKETQELAKNVERPPRAAVYQEYSKELILDYDPRKIIYEPLDTISAVLKYEPDNFVDFLVFASEKHFGGGVASGAKAQEEDIFLCTDLCALANDDFVKKCYPLNGILMAECHVIRDSNFRPIEPVPARAIFAAAPNRNHLLISEFSLEERLNTLTEITTLDDQGTALIIGAWGCGVFKNDPLMVANAFKQAMGKLLKTYMQIIVAIPDPKLLKIFKEVLNDEN